jgi:tripartite-type tricarboxylate transporter receptor subunit TctC
MVGDMLRNRLESRIGAGLRRGIGRFLVAVSAALALGGQVQAQGLQWPSSRPVKFIVPFVPGGATDVLTRILCEHLTSEFGSPFIVENRGGAGGNIGAAYVAASAPDGYTFLMGAPGTLAYNKALYRQMSYDPDKDLDPVSLFAMLPNVLVVYPQLQAKNVAALIAYANANPNKLNYGSIGFGATSFLSVELFKSMAGVEIQDIPYNGTNLALADLFAGRIQVMIDNLISYLPAIQAGKLRVLGVSTARRSLLLPDVPTISEAGVPGYEASSWIMVAAPHGTSAAIIGRLVAAMKKIAAAPDFTAHVAKLGAEPVVDTPGEARRFVKAEEAKWDAIIVKTGAHAE